MKKKYSIPMLRLAHHGLAADWKKWWGANAIRRAICPEQLDAGDEEGETYVDVLGNACTINVSDNKGGDDNDTFCYHGPINPYDLFINS